MVAVMEISEIVINAQQKNLRINGEIDLNDDDVFNMNTICQ